MARYCSGCGMPLNDGAKFCPGCGRNPSENFTRGLGNGVGASPTIQVVVGPAPTSASGLSSASEVPIERSTKTRGTFLALGFTLGFLGIHDFYIGKHGLGAVKLIITFISFGTLLWVSWIWAGIEVFVMDRDAQGRKLL